jgi:hypothetical protein
MDRCDVCGEPEPCLCARWIQLPNAVLPETDVPVLVTYTDPNCGRVVCTAHLVPTYDDEGPPHEWRDGDWAMPNVLAWQPLPAPWGKP